MPPFPKGPTTKTATLIYSNVLAYKLNTTQDYSIAELKIKQGCVSVRRTTNAVCNIN